MGELLRRYWYPVAFTRELEEFPVKRARLLGEDFAVFKTPRGRYGMRAGGLPAPAGLAGLRRGGGRRPALPVPRLAVRHRRHLPRPARRAGQDQLPRPGAGQSPGRSQELGGLIWAYVGPAPGAGAAAVRRLRDGRGARHRLGRPALQLRPDHGERRRPAPRRVAARPVTSSSWRRHQGFDAPASFGKKHVKVGFDAVRVGHHQAPGGRGRHRGGRRLEGRPPAGVPLQHAGRRRRTSSRCRSGCRSTGPPPGSCSTRCTRRTACEYPDQPQVPDYQIPVFDENGRHRVDYVEGQDMMAWVTQGPITDRTVEHLGRSDVGVTMLRRMFKEQMARVAARRGPARSIPGLPRPDRPAVREEQVRRGRVLRHPVHRAGLVPVQPAGRRAEEAAHQGAREPEGRGRVTAARPVR